LDVGEIGNPEIKVNRPEGPLCDGETAREILLDRVKLCKLPIRAYSGH
jgi:hypothetical protein